MASPEEIINVGAAFGQRGAEVVRNLAEHGWHLVRVDHQQWDEPDAHLRAGSHRERFSVTIWDQQQILDANFYIRGDVLAREPSAEAMLDSYRRSALHSVAGQIGKLLGILR